jgi:hypothetical protein
MQALGQSGYYQQLISIWQIAEQLMSLFEQALPDANALLVGRAAQGHFDAGVVIHIRLYSQTNDVEIASLLVEHGYEEPTFKTAESRLGRLSQICFQEEGVDVVVTRCPSNMALPVNGDLFTAKPVEALGLTALRARIDGTTQP